MNTKLTLNDLIKIILRHLWVVIILMIVGTGASLVLQPSESSSHTVMTQLIVSPKARYDISTATISDLIKSKKVLGVAVTEYNKGVESAADKVTYADLYDSLLVEVNGNSRMVTITAEEGSVKDAKRLVSGIAERAKIVADTDLPSWKTVIVTKATTMDKTAEGFSKKKAVVLGAGVGLFLGILLTFVLEAFQVKSKKHQKA